MAEVERSAARTEESMEHDPLHDALVAVFEAIAEREDKTIEEVVAEFVEGYDPQPFNLLRTRIADLEEVVEHAAITLDEAGWHGSASAVRVRAQEEE